jgi:hypothetical protein
VVLAYYRGVGGRYDRVIGVGSANSRNITNWGPLPSFYFKSIN